MPDEVLAPIVPIAEGSPEAKTLEVVANTPAEGTNPGSTEQETTPTVPTETKPAEVPTEYTFKVPAGMEADTAMLAKYEPVFKELGLSNEAAQKLVDQYSADKQAELQAHQEAMTKQVRSWHDAVKADPEIGGVKFDASVKAGQRVMAKYGTPELLKVLTETGMGNHPELVRAFARVGAAMAEDTIVTGGMGAGPRDPAKTMFPNMN